jgi:hypothetical protein
MTAVVSCRCSCSRAALRPHRRSSCSRIRKSQWRCHLPSHCMYIVVLSIKRPRRSRVTGSLYQQAYVHGCLAEETAAAEKRGHRGRSSQGKLHKHPCLSYGRRAGRERQRAGRSEGRGRAHTQRFQRQIQSIYQNRPEKVSLLCSCVCIATCPPHSLLPEHRV